MKTKHWITVVMACLIMPSAWAASLSVTDAWARITMPGQKVSGAYMQLQSDADARLVGLSSPAVGRVEMHEMSMDGGVMRMRELKSINLPKGQVVTLEPGGFHLMLMNLKKPIAAGDVVPLTLVVESGGKRQKLEVKAVARGRDDAAMDHSAHHHH